MKRSFDVIIVGAGNAAMCAALAAREQGQSVLVLEKAPIEQRGGNSYFTDGAMRCALRGIEAVRRIIPDMSDEEAAKIVLPPYSEAAYMEDMRKVTHGQSDERMAGVLTSKSFETMVWMAGQGIKFAMIYDNQSFEQDGKYHFWGNLNIKTEGRGVGLMARHFELAEARGIELWYEARATTLLQNEQGAIIGVALEHQGRPCEVYSKAVVLACGSFEANEAQRSTELGELWQHAVLRGSSHNTGAGLDMALAAGAVKHGQWSGCHNIATDAKAPKNGDYFDKPGDIYKKHSYPFSVMVNKDGLRFVDEGADFRNYTYAKYGQEVLKQRDQIAYQVYDAQVRHLLRSEYWEADATRIEADTLEALADQMDVDRATFLRTIAEYNATVQDGVFNPHDKDSKATQGLALPKSHWANTISEGPFLAFPVTCGITFTFGGVKVNEGAEVLEANDKAIPGLFAAGEMVGGLFYDNYPGGSGLMSGAVFGKIAGESAAAYCQTSSSA